MNDLVKTMLSLSVSGSALILLLLTLGPLVRKHLSRRWQYYVWLVAVARLLLPFTPEESLVGNLFRQTEEPSRPGITAIAPVEQDLSVPSALVPETPAPTPAESKSLLPYLWLIWPGVGAALLLRKITVYQDFIRYIRAGRQEVSDIALLDALAREEEALGVRRPVELYTHSLISSPLLLGFFHPAIILPTGKLPEEDFRYTVRHELIHYKRGDLLYKWLVQLTLCVHWFNPLVWLMAREIARACELACDEAVVKNLAPEERRTYGDTLLRAMWAGDGCGSSLAAVTLAEGGERLKERLGVILNFRRPARGAAAAALLLTACLLAGAGATGAYSVPPKSRQEPFPLPVSAPAPGPSSWEGAAPENPAEQYYQEGELAQFAAAFPGLEAGERQVVLERAYSDENIAYFSAAINQLGQDDPLLREFAERAYQENKTGFFSALTWRMGQKALWGWLARAEEEHSVSFQLILLGVLGREEEAEAIREGLEQKRLEEYSAYGITKDGNLYYYQGQPVRVLMDLVEGSGSCTLETNPLGRVAIQILRGEDGSIQSVRELPKEEAAKLFGEMAGPDDGYDKGSKEKEALSGEMAGPDDGHDKGSKEKEALSGERLEEYRAYGITKEGKRYFYQGKPVRVFLDLEGNNSFYTLEINPAGAVDVKVTRESSGRIAEVREMTGEEAAEFLEDWAEPGEENTGLEEAGASWQTHIIPVEAATVDAGEYIWLGTFAMEPGDRVSYNVSAQAGEQLTVGFARAGESAPKTIFQAVSSARQEGEELRAKTGFMAWEAPLEPGEYLLFLRADSGSLQEVTGSVVIVSALKSDN